MLVLCLALLLAAAAEVTLQPQVAEQPGFTVIGIEARTNNTKEAGSDGIIGKQWQRLMSEHLLESIPGKLGPDIYAVYTEYASDANGDYTYILGAKVEPAAKPPDGMVRVDVPAGRYAEFTSEKGPVQKVVPGTWKQVWEYFSNARHGQRAYRADYELYDQRAADPANAQVAVNIGLK